MIRAYEEIIDFIAAGTTPVRVAHFEASPETKDRVADLIHREKTNGLNADETSELDYFLKMEHLMRLAKARAEPSVPMSSYVSADLRRLVALRAGGLCEYCLIHENDSYLGCHVDHIISEKHGGLTESENLAYACACCNRAKGSNSCRGRSSNRKPQLAKQPFGPSD